MRRFLIVAGAIVLLSSIVTLALASRRIVSEQAAFTAPSAGRCEASRLNVSALLPGTTLAVSPLPGSYDAPPRTAISMLGVPAHLLEIHVDGAKSGPHSGRLRAFSQGDGASFLPSQPFIAGESVSVRGHIRVGSHTRRFAYNFVVAHPDNHLYSATAHVAGSQNQVMHFHSRPELQAPSLVVSATSPQSAPGYIFAAPYSGPGPAGPMIFDEAGNLVWFDPLASGASANLQVQLEGHTPVLTWWQGRITTQGFGQGEEMIYDSSYHQLGRVHAGNGLKADLHDFHITPQGTALLTAFDPIDCNLSALGGPAGAAVTDTVMQELDLATGLVRREWHSLDHVRLADSYSTATHASEAWPYDYFHLNSFQQLANGRTLISSRNTSALYELDTTSGQVLASIGGRHSTYKLGAGASTAYQHDASELANGTISIFDNGGVPKVHPQSRGIVIALDPTRKTDTVLAQYEHSSPISAASQGGFQTLSNGDAFISWGSSPYFSEFSSAGKLLFDAHMHGTYQSYRGYRFDWTGTPAEAPAIVATTSGARTSVYVSWNGDTRTATWRLLGGPSASQLAPIVSAPRSGFETTLSPPAAAPYLQAQALDATGAVIATSKVIKG
ncbi:MAG TPA: arylsulfotransferase family protein [Solirubrobacteraceae bacterium]